MSSLNWPQSSNALCGHKNPIGILEISIIDVLGGHYHTVCTGCNITYLCTTRLQGLVIPGALHLLKSYIFNPIPRESGLWYYS